MPQSIIKRIREIAIELAQTRERIGPDTKPDPQLLNAVLTVRYQLGLLDVELARKGQS